ncbi:hypothetical protein AL518_12030 [Hafnia paralvei]|uniref:hypothetical protein n=1 Tax=Hafnia paralvei TaxID=546367 RepID=UPI00076B6E95|nr:hypothetical protein [Hafnia paralvei]AMH18675.1 hypothetical protein AL518_12030 [Hafnia paralvei]
MDWQGVPFRLLDGNTVERLSVALDAIPKINIETPTDYTTAIATVVTTLLAGFIPAGLSWWLFLRNSENTKKEREAQEIFLKADRIAQQDFLKNEREAQIRVQLEISKQNFNMQVLSTNRHTWVNELRDRIADVIALAPIYQNSMFDVVVAQEHSKKLDLIECSEHNLSSNEKLYNKRDEAFNNFYSLRTIANNYNKDMGFLIAKITLMLNPNEEISTRIVNSLNKIHISCVSITEPNVDELSERYKELLGEIKTLTKYVQSCLKAEWERVKQGQ